MIVQLLINTIMNKLNFTATMSIDRFKSVHNISTINVVKNPHTSKRFFVCPADSSISGKIAETIDFAAPLYVSDCTDPDSAESFRLLHNRTDNTANIVATL